MKVKELDRTANIAWSPAQLHPIYMVAGTAAQQLDATFSTTAALELYSLNLGDPSLDMPLVASYQSDCRFHKVAWGCQGTGATDRAAGVIVAGADSGKLLAYDAAKLVKNDRDCLIFKKDKHSGAVKALDFNPFQSNLLVSGGAESEIFIWDLNNPETPMTPGAKSQPPEDVACVSWNRQVQHILASTFATKCVVWDLRKNEPIIKVSDSMSRIKCKLVCWNPEVATQMCLSSEDDHTPVIQLWDLRYATSPVKVLENHQRGILSMAWCPQDPELLLSCGKDNRILCWNPNSAVQGGEVVYELPTSHQWCFDVQWCPRNPNVISSSSFDGHVTAYSLMGGGHPIHQGDRVAESFSSSDPFSQGMSPTQTQNFMPLQKPPKWLQRPVGANFGFGGKLVSFENTKSATSSSQPSSLQVHLSQVVTETDLLTASLQLEQAMTAGQHVEYCAMKAANCTDGMQESIWNFLMVNFEKEPRERYIQLLGYDKTELATKVSEHTKTDSLSDSLGAGVDADELAQKMNLLSTGDNAMQMLNLASSGQASPSVGSKTPGSQDELNLSDGATAFDEIGSHKTHSQKSDTPLTIATDDDAEGLLSQALLTGNFEAAVDVCLRENKMAEAILLAIAGGPELLSRTQRRYFQRTNSSLGRLISAVVTHDWSHIVTTCDLDNWKEALAIILTYSPAEEFADLCDMLAGRLEAERSGDLATYASLCYVCSGNVERLVHNWLYTTDNNNSPLALQDLVEKVMLLRKAVEYSRGHAPEISAGVLADKLSGYASLLAAQGNVDIALKYLGDSNEASLCILRDRLYQALGQAPQGMAAPPSPWQKVAVVPQTTRPAEPTSSYQRTAQPQPKTYQAQAGSTFNTVTTGSTSQTNQPQYTQQFANMNGYAAVAPYSNQTPVMSQASGVTNKGPLAHKYPAYTQPTATSSYGATAYQSGTGQPDFNQTSQAQGYYSGSYMTPASQSSGSPTSLYPGAGPGGPFTSQPPVSTSQLPMPTYVDNNPGWNDPPMVKPKDNIKRKLSNEPPAPITTPIYGSQPQQTADQGPPGAPVNFGNYYNPQEHQPEPPQQFTGLPQPVYTNSHDPAPAKPTAPEPPVEVVKGPVPDEHRVLQEIFGALVQNCHTKATNAQMKRKLDDVARKLEILYDRLRDSTLSSAVTLGLHQIVQAIQQYDYNSGLSIYTQMVSQGNFSEISGFMPGLKILIQSASQLQVYVQ